MSEKAKRYREKKKGRMGDAAYRDWERERKKKYRERMITDQRKKEAALLKDRERKRLKRERAQAARTGFGNRQSLWRSVSKAKAALPKNTPRKVEVLEKVVDGLSQKAKKSLKFGSKAEKVSTAKLGRPSWTPGQTEWVTEFLCRPNISYTCPGKKDTKYMGVVDGEREYHAKHYLLWEIRVILGMLESEIQNLPEAERFTVSYGSVQRHIKALKYMRFKSNIPDRSCLCDNCENLELLLTGIRQKINVPTDPVEFLMKTICSLTTECVKENCQDCGNGNEYFSQTIDSLKDVEEVSFYKWQAGPKYPEKSLRILSGDEAAVELSKQLKMYKRHHFNRCTQYQALKKMKESLPGSKKAVIQVDYSENYVNVQRNEVQSAYFGHDNFSLYTICIWYGVHNNVSKKSFCIISDELSHEKHAAFVFNQKIIEKARELVPGLEEVSFWSDGCAAQFKSKYCFQLMTAYPHDLTFSWNYFESHHGKGPVDGIGGTIKTTVYSDVRANKVTINSAKQFAEYAEQRVHGITTMFISKEVIEKSSITLPDRVPEVPGTHQVHYVVRNIQDGVQLEFYENTQSNGNTPPFRVNDYELFTKKKVQSRKPTKEMPNANLKVGHWYATYFEEFNYYFVGVCQEVRLGEFKLDFLEQKDIGVNEFAHPRNDDLKFVRAEQVFHHLSDAPHPISSSRASLLALKDEDFAKITTTFLDSYRV